MANRRAYRVAAWGLFAMSGAAAGAVIALDVRSGEPASRVLTDSAMPIVFPLVGALIASRHPRNAVGWVFIAVGLFQGVAVTADLYADAGPAGRTNPLPLAAEAAWLATWTWIPSLIGLVTFVFLLFPDGRPPSPAWRWPGWTAGLGTALVVLPLAIGVWPIRSPTLPGDLSGVEELDWTVPFAIAGFSLAGIAALGSMAALVVRFRRSRDEERLQLKWFVFACLLVLAVVLIAFTPWPTPEWVLILTIQSLPVSAGIAILKYRLYDIDVVINRSLVYGGLTAGVVGLYLGTVALMAQFFERTGLGVSLVGAGVAAVVFQPLRERLQRVVNRLMYGDRDDPYTGLSRLGRRLEASIAPGEVLSDVAETVAQALRLPYVAVELQRDGGTELAARHGRPVEDSIHLPLAYQGETVGRLVVGPRGPGEHFSPADTRLLEDLARQASVAAHAVRLTSDLQRSRERLVVAREEERRRLRRDLHDGLGPTLAGVALQIETVRTLLRDDPDAADALLARLKNETQAAIVGIRRIVYDLRPPALDELGLVGALREEGSRFASNGRGLLVSIEAPEDLPPLPAAVEVAAYRIALEGLTNAARHSGAKTCLVRMIAGDGFQLEVRDDGRGLPSDFRPGVGLTSMRERAAELGGTLVVERVGPGGTRIMVRIPLASS